MFFDLTSIKSQVQNLEVQHQVKVNKKRELELDLTTKQTEKDRIRELISIKVKTVKMLQDIGNHAREETKEQLEFIVTSALRSVFQEDIAFKISYDIKRKKPVADFTIVNNYDTYSVETIPEDFRGGGLIDVISVSLRIALAVCFGHEGPLILDEPAKHLSAEYIPAFAAFLNAISRQFDRQIIMITHNNILAGCGDMVYHVEKRQGVSVVETLEQYERNKASQLN